MIKILKKAMPALLMALGVGLFVILLDTLLSITIMKTVDAAMLPEKTGLKTHVIQMLLITLAILPLNILLAFLKGKYKMKSMRSLKEHYLIKVFNKDLASFDEEHNTDYVSGLTQDMTTLENGYVSGKYEVVYQSLSFIFGLAVIVYVSPWIPVIGVILAAFVAGISIVLSKPIKKHQESRSNLFQGYTAYIQSFLNGFHIIKVNDLTEKAALDFHNKSEVIQKKGYVIDKMNSYIFALQNLMMTSLMIGMMGAATYLTLQGKMTFGGIILVINSAEKILGPVQIMGEWLPKISSSKILFKKMDDQLLKDAELALETYEDEKEITLENSLKLEGVTYCYNPNTKEENEVLSDICLEFKKNHKYLVMGPSGGGKSTLLKLIRKYHEPTEGKITIDDKDLSLISHKAYYQMIANVEQHVFLFEDSFRENLCLYKDYSDEAIEKAIKEAGLKPLVDALPQGLETIIYDNGKNLSGGEKSRLAIARALLQQAQILILDEAFSSLDDQVAKSIEKTLLALESVTLINVSHVCFEETKATYNRVLKVANKKIK